MKGNGGTDLSEPTNSASLELQLDALLSQVESDAASASMARAEAEQPSKAAVHLDAAAAAEAALAKADDLASKLDAMFAAPSEPSKPKAAFSQAKVAVDVPGGGSVDARPSAGLGDLASKLDAMLAGTASDADGDPMLEASYGAVAGDDGETPGQLMDEAELLAAVESDVADEAEAALDQAQAGGGFAALADMLGLDTEELAAIPHTPTQEELTESDVEQSIEEEFAGAFSSVDDLLAEMDPELAALRNDTDPLASEAEASQGAPAESFDNEEFAGSFEAFDGGSDAADEDGTESESVSQAVAVEAEPVAAEPMASTVQSDAGDGDFEGDFASVDELLVDTRPSPDPTPKPAISAPPAAPKRKLAEVARVSSKQAFVTGQTLVIRLKPHAIRAAKLSYRGFKIGCFHAQQPLDIVADKVTKDDAEAPPIRQYAGVAAMAVLIPGVFLVLLGLLT